MRVLITGATGFIGKAIVKQLIDAGDEVVVFTRNVAKAAMELGTKCEYVQWSDTTSSLPPLEAFNGVTGIINLMGESIAAKRWDEKQKKKIYDSRIKGTANLVAALSQLNIKPSVMVSTSAVGVYGNRGGEEVNESSTLGNDFLSHVCKDWEIEANKAQDLGLRVAIIRVGVVLGKGGGVLQKLTPIFKLGVGGPVGSGQQYMSWIHVDDLASMYIQCLKNLDAKGVFNGTAPYPATNKEFSKVLGKSLNRPAFMPAPAFAIKKMLGEMSTIVLDGQKVMPAGFKDMKFRYQYPTLEIAVKETI